MKEALLERQKLAKLQQDKEEQARMKASESLVLKAKIARGPFVAGTLAETMEARSRWGHQPSSEEIEKMKRDATLAKHASLVRYLEKKLASVSLAIQSGCNIRDVTQTVNTLVTHERNRSFSVSQMFGSGEIRIQNGKG